MKNFHSIRDHRYFSDNLRVQQIAVRLDVLWQSAMVCLHCMDQRACRTTVKSHLKSNLRQQSKSTAKRGRAERWVFIGRLCWQRADTGIPLCQPCSTAQQGYTSFQYNTSPVLCNPTVVWVLGLDHIIAVAPFTQTVTVPATGYMCDCWVVVFF